MVQRAGHPELVPDDFKSRPMRFARGGSKGNEAAPAFPTYSLINIFDPHLWETNFQNGAYFRDKIVLVGPTATIFHDVQPTPAGVITGAELHLEAVNALLNHDFLTPFSSGVAVSIVLAAALITLLLAAFIHSIGLRFGLALVVAAVYVAIVMLTYNGPGWLLPVVAPTIVFSGSVGVGFVYDFVVSQLERYRLRITFERYNSKNVVKYLLAHPDSYKEMLVGTRRDVSVLFSDIRSFTTIVETAPDSRELVRKLNEYLTGMVDCVIKQDGNLEKFMGDGIMAVWGNTPYSAGSKDDAIRAVRAALAMTVELKRLNAKWLSEGRTEWRIGVGVNHGSVIVGDMGSPEHKEFAMVGDPVNLGSRLEGLTKEYHVQIMLGELTAELVGDVFFLRSVDLVKVKGKNKAVKAFTVLGERSAGLPPEKEKFLQLHEEAMAAFRAREFDRARKLFELALQLEPDDYIAGTFLESASHYAETPPDEGWDGVRVMKEK
jgi:adenylate cyclase